MEAEKEKEAFRIQKLMQMKEKIKDLNKKNTLRDQRSLTFHYS
jgi:hypothetical protein